MRWVKECLSGILIRLAWKFHKLGIKFEDEHSCKPIEAPIKNPDSGKEIERFYCLTREWHGQNTCQKVTNSDIQFLKYPSVEAEYRRDLQICKTVPTTRDYRARIREIQAMTKVANYGEQALLMAYTLGLTIEDVELLNRPKFDRNRQPHIPIETNTKKEQAEAGTFSNEFRHLSEKHELKF